MSHLLRSNLHNRKRFNPYGPLKQHVATLCTACCMTHTVVKYKFTFSQKYTNKDLPWGHTITKSTK